MSAGDPRRWISLRLGQKKYQWQLPQQKESWHTTYSFLVYDLTQDLVSFIPFHLIRRIEMG